MVNLKEKITHIPEIVTFFASFISKMKIFSSLNLKLVTIGLLVASLELLAPMSANAQNQVVAEPAQVTVSGMRGTVATRNIVLQTETPINNLQLIPFDLNRSDGDSIFPAQAITVEKPSVSSTVRIQV